MAVPKIVGIETEFGVALRGAPEPNPVVASSLLINGYVEQRRIGWDFEDESPGKDARLHITRAWQQGKPIEVAAAWGIDPLFMVVGSQTFPKNISEYEFAGGIKVNCRGVQRREALHTAQIKIDAMLKSLLERPLRAEVDSPAARG